MLKWVKKEDEAEVRAAFKQVLAVRTKGQEAYVEFMYYAEWLYRDALGNGPHHGTAAGPKTEGCDHH